MLATLGRLDKLLQSGSRFSQQLSLLAALADGTLERVTTKRIGSPLLFGRLWETTGCKAVVDTLLADRAVPSREGLTAPSGRGRPAVEVAQDPANSEW